MKHKKNINDFKERLLTPACITIKYGIFIIPTAFFLGIGSDIPLLIRIFGWAVFVYLLGGFILFLTIKHKK